jgi:hypothetical protein
VRPSIKSQQLRLYPKEVVTWHESTTQSVASTLSVA